MSEKPPCEVCERFAERKDESTPCQDCLPELMDENKPIWWLYTRVAGQVRMGPMGPVDLDMLAVKMMMDLHEMTNQPETLERVMRLWRHLYERAKEKPRA